MKISLHDYIKSVQKIFSNSFIFFVARKVHDKGATAEAVAPSGGGIRLSRRRIRSVAAGRTISGNCLERSNSLRLGKKDQDRLYTAGRHVVAPFERQLRQPVGTRNEVGPSVAQDVRTRLHIATRASQLRKFRQEAGQIGTRQIGHRRRVCQY